MSAPIKHALDESFSFYGTLFPRLTTGDPISLPWPLYFGPPRCIYLVNSRFSYSLKPRLHQDVAGHKLYPPVAVNMFLYREQNCRQFVARLLLDTKGYKSTVT